MQRLYEFREVAKVPYEELQKMSRVVEPYTRNKANKFSTVFSQEDPINRHIKKESSTQKHHYSSKLATFSDEYTKVKEKKLPSIHLSPRIDLNTNKLRHRNRFKKMPSNSDLQQLFGETQSSMHRNKLSMFSVRGRKPEEKVAGFVSHNPMSSYKSESKLVLSKLYSKYNA